MLKLYTYAVIYALMGGAITFPTASFAQSEAVSVAPVGDYAEIDTRLAKDVLSVLENGSTDEKKAVIERVKANPERYAPPVFYAMSQVLFGQGNKDDAAFWFYAGQLRARFDANRCLDMSARSAVGILNQQYGPPINQYMFTNLTKLEELIPRVVKWDRETSHDYDHRWINLHGMSAMISGLGSDQKAVALSAPKEQWAEIEERTRDEYLNGFMQALAQMKKR